MPCEPVTPASISVLYVGMYPSAAYFCMRSGRMPSEANMTVRCAVPTGLGAGGLGAAVVGAAPIEKSKAVKARRTSGRKRLDDLGTGVLPRSHACVTSPDVGEVSASRTLPDRTQRP